jgi:hypothetical protein
VADEEITEALFVALKTVEMDVAPSPGQLGICSRTQLA